MASSAWRRGRFDNLDHPPVYSTHQRRHLSDRAARGSVSLRKMACRSAAGVSLLRFKAIDAR